MTSNEYQIKAHEFADYSKPVIVHVDKIEDVPFVYPALGLAEEAGEVSGKFAKIVRDNNGKITDEKRAEIIKELGDVMWFVSELSTLLNVSLEDVMQNNIDKLTSRKTRGVIHGSGDNR